MQLHLPSPQQIYDLSTQQLSKLQTQLQRSIGSKRQTKSSSTQDADYLESLTELLENISLEIEERKTIEYFTELCMSDGTASKYVKEITDFNNEFTKLANQMLNNKEGSSSYQENQGKSLEKNFTEKDFKSMSEKHESRNLQSKESIFRESQSSQNTITTNSFNKENHTIGTEASDFGTSATSDMNKKATSTITKKMGVGQTNMKKNRNSMQEFIKATLAKSKPVEYVSTKGGSTLKKSPDNKIHGNASQLSHHEIASTPMSTTKSIKPPSQSSDTGSNARKQAPSSNKSIPASQKSINDRQNLMKKRNDAIQKMKSMKKPEAQASSQNHPPQPSKKKGGKGLDAKSLVEMVKQQEDAKKRREQQPVEDRRKGKQQKKVEQRQKQYSESQILEQKLGQIESKNLANKQCSENKPKQQKILTKESVSTKTFQKQNEFPIKEEINAMSSSDTESDSDSVRLSGSGSKRINSKKEIGREEKYCPIPEEQIEESIVFVKDRTQTVTEQNQGHLTVVNQGLLTVNQEVNAKKTQKFQTQKKSHQLQSQVQKTQSTQKKTSLSLKQQQRKTSIVETKTHNFGKITQEYYNPNGYDNEASQSEEDQKNPQDHKQSDFQQPQENSQNENQTQIEDQPKTSESKKQNTLIKPESMKKIAEKSEKSRSSKNLKKKKEQKKTVLDEERISPSIPDLQSKMYNEEYWLHIKEEAETKIQRFKQEKQIQRKQRELKAKLIEEESKRLKAEFAGKKPLTANGKQGKSGTENTEQFETRLEENSNRNQEALVITLQDDDNDKFIEQQKSNLKKIQAENNLNGSSKKGSKKPQATVAIVKQPKPSYPKPEFNYLEVYPTFNHIFNVFYTKPESQALLDIPLVMKDMIEMFQTHLEYQNNRKNYFRPAIFMPFDTRNSKINQFNDARSLLQHAETTYVNLKTLIQRVQIFNSNIQGEFQNCTEQERQKTQFYRVVKTKEEVYDIITTSFLRRKGWKELPHGQNLKANWNLFWSWSKPEIDMNKLIVFQRINHYPFNKNLSRKDLLYKNIDSFRKTHKVPFPYLPVTYNLPKEFTQFSKRFHEEQLVNRQKNYWIMKPIGKSRGRGIKLINSLGDLNYLDNIVVQKYISNPLLIDGYKFDMRIYVLVTSFHPLEAFVYREGFARFSTEKYSLEPMDMKNNFVHLTNFAINRHNQQANEQFTEGSKISLKSLKQKVTKMGYSFASVWSQVHEIIIKSLLACSVSMPPFPAAFQLFGYDIMLDDTGQCSLIEINASPSLQRSYMIDDIIKQSLIDDIIEIVNPPAFSKEQAINVMNERLSPEFRNYKKGQKGANVDEEDLIHLARILKYQKMRKYGEMPERIGLFEMVAPSPMSKDLEKLIKSKSGINAPHNID